MSGQGANRRVALPGRAWATARTTAALVLLAGIAVAGLSGAPVGMAIILAVLGLIAAVVAKRLSDMSAAIEDDLLVVRRPFLTMRFAREDLRDVTVENPEWGIGGSSAAGVATRPSQDCRLIMRDGRIVLIARAGLRAADVQYAGTAISPDLYRLEDMIRKWLDEERTASAPFD